MHCTLLWFHHQQCYYYFLGTLLIIVINKQTNNKITSYLVSFLFYFAKRYRPDTVHTNLFFPKLLQFTQSCIVHPTYCIAPFMAVSSYFTYCSFYLQVFWYDFFFSYAICSCAVLVHFRDFLYVIFNI